MVNVPDPCNVVPDSTIPSGLSLHRHHAVHHAVGRIKHTIHHKFPILPAHAPVQVPSGCEKHAILPPRPGGSGLAGPGAAAPATKLAALGGAGAGLVALGGLGGLVGGIIPGVTGATKTSLNPPGTTTITTNPSPPTPVPPTPTPPIITPNPPGTPSIPGTPPVSVPEPSAVLIFAFAVLVALAARYMHRRADLKTAVSAA